MNISDVHKYLKYLHTYVILMTRAVKMEECKKNTLNVVMINYPFLISLFFWTHNKYKDHV